MHCVRHWGYPIVVVLLVVVVAAAIVGTGLLIGMLRRDEPHLGVWALSVLLAAGVTATVYAALDG